MWLIGGAALYSLIAFAGAYSIRFDAIGQDWVPYIATQGNQERLRYRSNGEVPGVITRNVAGIPGKDRCFNLIIPPFASPLPDLPNNRPRKFHPDNLRTGAVQYFYPDVLRDERTPKVPLMVRFPYLRTILEEQFPVLDLTRITIQASINPNLLDRVAPGMPPKVMALYQGRDCQNGVGMHVPFLIIRWYDTLGIQTLDLRKLYPSKGSVQGMSYEEVDETSTWWRLATREFNAAVDVFGEQPKRGLKPGGVWVGAPEPGMENFRRKEVQLVAVPQPEPTEEQVQEVVNEFYRSWPGVENWGHLVTREGNAPAKQMGDEFLSRPWGPSEQFLNAYQEMRETQNGPGSDYTMWRWPSYEGSVQPYNKPLPSPPGENLPAQDYLPSAREFPSVAAGPDPQYEAAYRQLVEAEDTLEGDNEGSIPDLEGYFNLDEGQAPANQGIEGIQGIQGEEEAQITE
ncbi:hypothetical protein ABW19_dt0204986 [Dactylella cylindrospora]|nr:hypothetical protein ABW19_dt0204986 [Dactylella cylindrospora]